MRTEYIDFQNYKYIINFAWILLTLFSDSYAKHLCVPELLSDRFPIGYMESRVFMLLQSMFLNLLVPRKKLNNPLGYSDLDYTGWICFTNR